MVNGANKMFDREARNQAGVSQQPRPSPHVNIGSLQQRLEPQPTEPDDAAQSKAHHLAK